MWRWLDWLADLWPQPTPSLRNTWTTCRRSPRRSSTSWTQSWCPGKMWAPRPACRTWWTQRSTRTSRDASLSPARPPHPPHPPLPTRPGKRWTCSCDSLHISLRVRLVCGGRSPPAGTFCNCNCWHAFFKAHDSQQQESGCLFRL